MVSFLIDTGWNTVPNKISKCPPSILNVPLSIVFTVLFSFFGTLSKKIVNFKIEFVNPLTTYVEQF